MRNVVTNWPRPMIKPTLMFPQTWWWHEVMGEGPEQHICPVPDQEERRHREDEAAQPAAQVLEFRLAWIARYSAPGG